MTAYLRTKLENDHKIVEKTSGFLNAVSGVLGGLPGRRQGPFGRSWEALGRSWDAFWSPKNRKSSEKLAPSLLLKWISEKSLQLRALQVPPGP